jgi:hypothetical protein
VDTIRGVIVQIRTAATIFHSGEEQARYGRVVLVSAASASRGFLTPVTVWADDQLAQDPSMPATLRCKAGASCPGWRATAWSRWLAAK